MSLLADVVPDIAHVAAALSEGFCPGAHPLSYGGGRWGTCNTCQMTWTLRSDGYTFRALSDPIGQLTSVTKDGSFPTVQYWFLPSFSDAVAQGPG